MRGGNALGLWRAMEQSTGLRTVTGQASRLPCGAQRTKFGAGDGFGHCSLFSFPASHRNSHGVLPCLHSLVFVVLFPSRPHNQG